MGEKLGLEAEELVQVYTEWTLSGRLQMSSGKLSPLTCPQKPPEPAQVLDSLSGSNHSCVITNLSSDDTEGKMK